MNVKSQQQNCTNQYQQTDLDGFDDNSLINFHPHIIKDFTNKEKIISSSVIKGTDLDLKHSLSLNSSTSSSTMLGRKSNSPVSSNNNCTTATTMPTIGVNLRVTGHCSQGGRKYMEDYFSVAYQQSENCCDLEYAFIGIYDGHGGAEAATFAKEHLMMEIINQKNFWSDCDQDVLCAIREGYIATHYAMWREQEKWPTTANGLLSTAGTTATIAFIRREKIYIGHVGDSGIVLGYQNENENFWRAKQLTTDHKPESSTERKRIMRSGGKIGVKSGVPRVVWNRPRNADHRGPTFPNTPVDEIPFLAVARSLGDLWSYNAQLNEFVVSPVPDVQIIRINPKTFRCLIFGTDGLWNVVTSQEAVDTVFKKETNNERINAQHQNINNSPMQDGTQWTNPSKALVEQALRTWSGKKMRADNTSVVTVILYPPSNVGNAYEGSDKKCAAERTECQLNYVDVDDSRFSITLRNQQSFQEISEKYLPPERFRNFNSFCVNFIDDHHIYCSTDSKIAVKSSQFPWCMETETNDNSNGVESAVQKSRKVQLNLQDFHELLKPPTRFSSQLEATYSNELYVNSFAETYNSILDAQIVRYDEGQSQSASTSTPTPTSIPNNSGLQMQQILREQQLYQQQCMSGEDGYLLTTLETPREQQRCSETSTIKAYEHLETESIQPNDYHQMEIKCNSNINLEAKLWSQSNDYNYQAQHQQSEDSSSSRTLRLGENEAKEKMEIMQPMRQRLLELNAVLQQEQAEEQQVAFEYEQLQQRMKQQRVENTHASQTWVSVPKIEERKYNISEEHYLLGYETGAAVQLDETVQINEISSSNSIPFFESVDIAKTIVTTTDRDPQPNDLELQDRIVTPTVFMEKIEKIEILADKPELVIEATPVIMLNTLTPAVKPSVDSKLQSSQKLKTVASSKIRKKTKNETSLSKAVKSPYFTARNHTHILNGSTCNKRLRNNNSTMSMHSSLISVPHSLFPNVPNENHRDSNTVTAVTGSSSQRCVTVNNNGSPNGKEHRQLRSGNRYNSGSSKPNTYGTAITTAQSGQMNNVNSSNPVGVDYYSKRTLRTRNSLTKELKAKISSSTNNTNNNSVLKRGVAIATQLIRANRAHSNCAAHVINLRSRQVNAQQLKHVSSTLNTNSRITVTTRKTRNLRSNPSTNSTDDNSVYSKTTRVQLVGGSTPLAPKLLRAATAVPATRARATASVQMAPVFRRRSAQRSPTTETITSTNSIHTIANTAIRRGGGVTKRVKH